MFRLNRKGFTLVEIMIVVAIIALLAAIAIPNLLTARRRANEAATQASLKSLATACEAYAASPGAGLYPGTAAIMIASGEFGLDLNGMVKGGYTYAITYDDAGYTAAATSGGANVGDWDYQITTGAILGRRPQGTAGTYTPF